MYYRQQPAAKYPGVSVVNEEKHFTLDEMIGVLTRPEQLVISSYFGINGKSLTLEQVEKKLNISEERVRQIKNNALEKMRNSFETAQPIYRRLNNVLI